MVSPQDEMIQLHELAVLACPMILNPFNSDLLTPKVLRSRECIPTMYIAFAWRIRAMIAGRICTYALVNPPQIVLNPHRVLNHQDGGCDIREDAKDTLIVNSILNSCGFLLNVIVLHQRIFATITQWLNRIVLREETKTERICFPSNQRIRIATLFAILALYSEGFRVKWWRDRFWINIACIGHDLASGKIDILVFVRPSFPTNALAKLASRQLILITTALTIPALRIAIVWPISLVQGIRDRGSWNTCIMCCLR
mmetsp:Transcript_95020/g.148649  ORF Transcript_95020/g.148649 Transcript_95020/m.148649 type:complete len:255 (-) Transcript_95020:643-1407(-)